MRKKTRRTSAKEFSDRFTQIVSQHLVTMPPDEQDQRIKNAERVARRLTRAERPIARRVEEIRPSALRSRTHE